VIATSSSDEKLELARRLGATHTINYRKQPDWDQEARRLTNNKGVDHVIEVGGAGTIEKSLNSLRQGGLVSIIGILTDSQQHDLIPSLLYGAKTGERALIPHVETMV
jgi:NADPH:quinone reductase-like Zn-dependent oxidoreductase